MRAKKLIVVSGVAGSGRSSALDALEDLGFFAVENLPGPLIEGFVAFLGDVPAGFRRSPEGDTFALLVDCREADSVRDVLKAMARIRAEGTDVQLLFLDCRDDILVRRFQETRRPHPFLMGKLTGSVTEAIEEERSVIADFRREATRVMDTSSFTPHQLREEVADFVGAKSDLAVTLMSFGFKYGPPKDADLVLDVRFLPNPHFVPNLRDHTGIEPEVREYVLGAADSLEFLERSRELIRFLLPRYKKEGKRYLTIAIGCTGGKHRSVVLAEVLGETLVWDKMVVRHRDKDRR